MFHLGDRQRTPFPEIAESDQHILWDRFRITGCSARAGARCQQDGRKTRRHNLQDIRTVLAILRCTHYAVQTRLPARKSSRIGLAMLQRPSARPPLCPLSSKSTKSGLPISRYKNASQESCPPSNPCEFTSNPTTALNLAHAYSRQLSSLYSQPLLPPTFILPPPTLQQ